MNNRLILVYITGILIGISYGLQGPLLPVFAKNVIGASYADLEQAMETGEGPGVDVLNKFNSMNKHKMDPIPTFIL